jgi:hypothetical protein
MYAPEANLTLNGGGNNNGLIGASMTKSITMNGLYNFHFDEDLLSLGPSRAYIVTFLEGALGLRPCSCGFLLSGEVCPCARFSGPPPLPNVGIQYA